MSDDRSTEVHFSRAAAVYHSRAEVQRAVADRLLEGLSRPFAAKCILELGCGTGFLTTLVRQAFPHAQIDALDLSAAMIQQARQRVGPNQRIHWHVCDGREYQASVPYDLIASSSSLQWMQPLPELFCRLSRMLNSGGRLLSSLMVEGTLGELHRLRREIAPHKAPRSRLPTVAETAAALQSAGLQITWSQTATFHTVHRSFRELLRSIRELGFTGGAVSTSSPLLTRGELKQLAQRYAAANVVSGGQIEARYVVYAFEARGSSDNAHAGEI